MADFRAALTKGLDANADAAAKKKEIYSVVEDASRQICEATNGDIQLEIRPRVRNVVRHFTNRLAMALGEEERREEVPYLQITAVRTGSQPFSAALGVIEIDDAGYPVAIRSGNAINERAWDRESLEKALTTLLEHPNTGGEIQRILDLKPAEPPTDSGPGRSE